MYYFCIYINRKMKQITDIHELRSIQMGILDHVHEYCMEHGLRYFLSSGTLIGAVGGGIVGGVVAAFTD